MNTRISLFCGGRGSAALIRELIRRPEVELNLLINAYDDGLSTGELREFIPGMLGPSDFRKTLSYLLDLYSNQQYALSSFLEFRLPDPITEEDLRALKAYAASPEGDLEQLPLALRAPVERIESTTLAEIRDYLSIFFTYCDQQGKPFNFADCSFGNLLFAGAYIKKGRSFNAATAELSRLFGSKARLINVTTGENRVLVGLKEDGEFLDRESKIVSAQSSSPIFDIFFLGKRLTDQQLQAMEGMGLVEKQTFLRQLELPVHLSSEAQEALANCDIIVYGTGTQHSSLLPSYKTDGLPEAIERSPAKLKLFLANIHEDYDIQGASVSWLLDRALYYLKDPDNTRRMITHAFCARDTVDSPKAIACDLLNGSKHPSYKGIIPVSGPFENPAVPGKHSGIKTTEGLLRLYRTVGADSENELDIFIDLNERSLGLPFLVQEFLELDWNRRFRHVRLSVNRVTVPKIETPPYLSIQAAAGDNECDEGAILQQWLKTGKSRCLVTLTGDGEYRLRDVISAVDVMENQRFGAVYGSRTQSRKQFLRALRMAYPESRLLHNVSWIANFLLAVAYGFRFQAIFSDPLTGFRVYRRTALAPLLQKQKKRQFSSAAAITKSLLRHDVEIAEIPVTYRTFRGFASMRWRIRRGIQNVIDVLY